MADRSGQHLGNYRLLRLLGKGAFAEVYLGEHRHLATQTAIKVLQAHLGSQADREDFLREAQTIAQLSHPHIVRVLDFDVEQEVPFLVMEYAPHGSLRARHPRGQQLPLRLVLSYVQQVASALQYAHGHRLIHRDVKPDNMLLCDEQTVILSDFGIVTIAHSTASGGGEAIAGTPAYMAPEQLQGNPRTTSDQYALAVTVYEWLSGQLPFRGTAMEVATQHTFKPPPSLIEQLPELPPEVEQVVFTGLAKDPKERFATIQAFASALGCAVQSEQGVSVSTKPDDRRATDPWRNTPKTFPSRRTVVAGLAGLTAVGVVGGGLFWLTHSKNDGSFMSAPPPTQTEIVQAKKDYEKNAAANGIMFGFDANHTRNNPYEILLNTDNVAGLKLYWEAPTKGRVRGTPIVAGGVVYIGCDDSYLYAFDATTGIKLWTAQTGGQVSSPALGSNKIVYVGSDDETLYAFDTTSGGTTRTPHWTAKMGGSLTSPTIANIAEGIVYSAQGNNLHAFNANTGGPPLWTAQTGDAILGSPAVFQGVVYIGSRDNNLYAFDALTGKGLWMFSTGAGIDASPTVAPDGIVYIGSRDGFIYARHAKTGTKVWDAPVDYAIINSSAAVANGIVYVGSRSSYMYAFDSTNGGTVLWSALTSTGSNGIESSPTVANGVVYVACDDGNVYAFNANTGGPPLWKASVGAFYTCPMVANGVVYIGAEFKNALYAFHLP